MVSQYRTRGVSSSASVLRPGSVCIWSIRFGRHGTQKDELKYNNLIVLRRIALLIEDSNSACNFALASNNIFKSGVQSLAAISRPHGT